MSEENIKTFSTKCVCVYLTLANQLDSRRLLALACGHASSLGLKSQLLLTRTKLQDEKLCGALSDPDLRDVFLSTKRGLSRELNVTCPDV